MTSAYCVDPTTIRSWLKQDSAHSSPITVVIPEFKERLYLGRILHHIFTSLQPSSSFVDWLDGVLCKTITSKTFYRVCDPNQLLLRVALKLNAVIRVYSMEPCDEYITPCTRGGHVTQCICMKLEYISAITNLRNVSRRKPSYTFVIDRKERYSVYVVDPTTLYSIIKIRDTNAYPVYNDSTLKKHLNQLLTLRNPLDLNFSSQTVVEPDAYIEVYLSSCYVDRRELLQLKNLQLLRVIGQSRNKEKGVALVILGGGMDIGYLAVSIRLLHNKIRPSLEGLQPVQGNFRDETYSRPTFDDVSCPCAQLEGPHKSRPFKKVSKPVGVSEANSDFTHVLKLLSMYTEKEQTIVKACCYLSAVSFDIER